MTYLSEHTKNLDRLQLAMDGPIKPKSVTWMPGVKVISVNV